MKRVSLLVISLLLCSISAIAQDQQQEKTALYSKFIANIKGEADAQKLAYEQGQEYLNKYAADNDQYVAYIRKWNAKYEKVSREFEFTSALSAKDWTKSFAAGRKILEVDGESFPVLIKLVDAGYRNASAGNTSLNNETIGLARKASRLLESGRLTDYSPFKSADDAHGFIDYTLGWMLRETSPMEAAGLARKAAKEGVYKIEPATYVLIASTTIAAEYEPKANEYNAKFSGKEVTPEGEAMAAQVKAIAERVIDAYARAAALLTKPDQQKLRNEIMEELTPLYKTFNNNSDSGLNELINSVLAKPLP